MSVVSNNAETPNQPPLPAFKRVHYDWHRATGGNISKVCLGWILQPIAAHYRVHDQLVRARGVSSIAKAPNQPPFPAVVGGPIRLRWQRQQGASELDSPANSRKLCNTISSCGLESAAGPARGSGLICSPDPLGAASGVNDCVGSEVRSKLAISVRFLELGRAWFLSVVHGVRAKMN
jgi:hypothetical protein